MRNTVGRLLEVGYSIATEQNYVKLFDNILNACVEFTNADGGSLFIADSGTSGSGGSLIHLLDVNKSLSITRSVSEADKYVAVDNETNIYTYTYHHRELLNIPNVYKDGRFDVSEIRQFDEQNDYHTISVLMVPLAVSDEKALGVLMLYNCMDAFGQVVPFDEDGETFVRSLTSQMANSLTSLLLIQDMEDLLGSFVESLTYAIDAKTPYNAHHTLNVAKYCMIMAGYINSQHTIGMTEMFINENDQEQLKMAAMLHDIGKIVTPREVLNKSTRLGSLYEHLNDKLEKIQLMMKIDFLEGRMERELWEAEDKQIADFLKILPCINIKDYLEDADLEAVNSMKDKKYVSADGGVTDYLTEKEAECLSIRKGTLTEEERHIVNQHVVYTDKMLANINFTEKFNKVRRIAADHHEYLNGTGYPRHKTAEELDVLSRVMTVCDIFDSLTADDRPYKRAHSLESAIKILKGMAEEGKLDATIVNMLDECMSDEWENIGK